MKATSGSENSHENACAEEDIVDNALRCGAESSTGEAACERGEAGMGEKKSAMLLAVLALDFQDLIRGSYV